jgi:hypothetical protein
MFNILQGKYLFNTLESTLFSDWNQKKNPIGFRGAKLIIKN